MPLKYTLILKILKELDFICVRSKGSHFRFKKKGCGLTVGFHKEYPPKTAKSMLKDIANISGTEYGDLIKKYDIKL